MRLLGGGKGATPLARKVDSEEFQLCSAPLGGRPCSAVVVNLGAGIESLSFFAENGAVYDSCALESEANSSSNHTQAVLYAALEIDGRRLLEIFCRTRHFSDAVAEVYALSEHLVV